MRQWFNQPTIGVEVMKNPKNEAKGFNVVCSADGNEIVENINEFKKITGSNEAILITDFSGARKIYGDGKNGPVIMPMKSDFEAGKEATNAKVATYMKSAGNSDVLLVNQSDYAVMAKKLDVYAETTDQMGGMTTKFFEELPEKATANSNNTIWVLVACVGGAIIIGGVCFIVIKRKKSANANGIEKV
ncbi:MAG: hypothetical protein RSA99_01595 [Oscillospiraceae bacterium]